MSGWADGPLCPFDTETDGADPLTARVITGTVSRVGRGIVRVDWTWLVKPERPIPEGAIAIHGITTAKAQAEGVERAGAIAEIVRRLHEALSQGVPVVAFNAQYDLTLIDREARRLGIEPLIDRLGGRVAPVLDPYVIDKAVDQYRRGKRNLGATCAHYGIALGAAHDSTADAIAAARVLYQIARRFPEIGGTDLAELHEMQVHWRAEQCASLERYKASQGNFEAIDPSWPMTMPQAGS